MLGSIQAHSVPAIKTANMAVYLDYVENDIEPGYFVLNKRDDKRSGDIG